jgi:fatty acid desaturase
MLSADELRPLVIPSGWRTSLAILFDWLLVIANFSLAMVFPHPAVWIFCFLFSARQQLAFAILMHDGAHRRLFKSAKWNDYICQFLCAAPLFFSMYSYQKLHLKHHREPLAPDDPDLSLIGGYPISKGSFLRKIARDAFGISYFKFIRYFIYKKKADASVPASGDGRIPFFIVLSAMFFMNFLIWLALYSVDFGWYYLFLWVLPAFTALQVLLRIRGIAEHAGYTANPDQSRNARTVINPVQTFIFAPHNVNYHVEHHIYPAVPFHNLPKLHRLMMNKNMVPAENIFRGYRQVLSELVK